MIGCSNPYGRKLHVAVAAGVLLFFGSPEVAAQTYPMPKPKPQAVGWAWAKYPLPTPNPRRPDDSPPAQTTAPNTSDDRSESWSGAQVAEGRRTCRDLLKDLSITYEEAEPIGGPGACGIAAPIRITALGGPKSQVEIKPPAVLNCALAAATARWMHSKVQIAALAAYGERVVGITNVSSYVCRRRNNKKDGRLSEHALGNALDVAAFTLASGKVITVRDGWRSGKKETLVEEVVSKVVAPETEDSRFLSQAHKGACDIFSTILGPDADKYHVDHFHLDLGRGGRYLICH